MGSHRNFVTFEADLPDDTVFAESGDISVPGGRNVCAELVEIFRSEGMSTSDPEQHEFYGWELTANLHGTETWVLLQRTEPWLLIIENRSQKSSLFRKTPTPTDASLNFIDYALKKSGKFSNVSWFTRNEYESGLQVGNPVP